jgi:hypothetical protein
VASCIECDRTPAGGQASSNGEVGAAAVASAAALFLKIFHPPAGIDA